MAYRIEIKRSAEKEIEDIADRRTRAKIIERIGALAENPRPAGSEKLSGAESYRIRQGDYRIVYTVEDQRLVVQVVKVGHRRDVYRH